MKLMLVAALTCTSLATRIAMKDHPTPDYFPDATACWGRKFSETDGCGSFKTEKECKTYYAFSREFNAFGACHWWNQYVRPDDSNLFGRLYADWKYENHLGPYRYWRDPDYYEPDSVSSRCPQNESSLFPMILIGIMFSTERKKILGAASHLLSQCRWMSATQQSSSSNISAICNGTRSSA